MSTPWGTARRVEAVTIPQRAGNKRFAAVVELLETGAGERLVRVAYSTGGIGRRGPVALRAADLVRLRQALEQAPTLREALLGDC